MDKGKLIEDAKALLKNENHEKAIDILEDLYKELPDPDIKKFLIEVLFAYGSYLNDDYVLGYEKSIKYFSRILSIEPKNYKAYYNLGIAYFNLKKFDTALDNYKIALSINPNYKYCYYNIGLIYEATKNFREAAEAYEKALEIDPGFIYAIHSLKAVKLMLENAKLDKNQSQHKSNLLKNLISLLRVTRRIRLEMLQELLNVDKGTLLKIIVNWGNKNYCELDGDYLIINVETRNQFIEDLNNGNIGI
jgi:tetratricopeptide (TPR) repeat protein